MTHEKAAPAGRPRSRRQARRTSNQVVLVLAVAAAVGGAFAGVHPTATPVVDPLYGAAFCVLVTFAASRAGRRARLVFAAIVLGASRGLIIIPAVATLGLAVSQVWVRRWRQRIGALIGALGSQVILRWPHLGFLGLTAILGAVAALVLVVPAVRGLRRGQRRRLTFVLGGGLLLLLIVGIPALVGAFVARHPASSGIAATRGALRQVTDGQASQATAQLDVATADFAAARRDTGSWWSAGARLVPVLAQQRQALADATGAADAVTSTAAAKAGGIDYAALRYADGRINLAQVAAMAQPVAELDTTLSSAQRTVDGIRSPWLLAPIQDRLRSLGSQLASAKHNADLASAAVSAAPSLLGGEGTRHYFVAFMTPAESRGLGGYVGAYGVLTVDDGKISLTAGGPTTGFPTTQTHFNISAPGSVHLNGPADYLQRYGPYLGDSVFGDLSYTPDLPTFNSVVSQAYPQEGGQPIDGTLAIDPAGLAALLKITGPVSVPGLPQPLTSANANNVLLRQQYLLLQQSGSSAAATQRHDYLQDALQAAFPRLVSGSLPGPRTLSQDLFPAVQAGDIQFWSSHPTDQHLLKLIKIDGSFPSAGQGDLLAVTTSNSSNDKLDAYLDKTVDDHVTYNPGTGAVTDQVTITLHNTAPSSGLPSYVIGGYPGSPAPAGTNVTWLSVYSPLRIAEDPSIHTDIQPQPVKELGVNAYSAFVTVPSETTVTLSMTLVGHIRATKHYSIALRLQPSATSTRFYVQVSPSAGWRARNGQPPSDAVGPAERQLRRVTFQRA
jgi:hypothetical protein